MVFAHFPSSSESPFISAVYFITGAAPALFYLAFGMTIDSYIQKTRKIKLRITLTFLIVAIFLNLAFAGTYIYMEFFFFLWLSQCAMAAIIACIRKPAWFILLFMCSILSCMIVAPHGYLSNAFSSMVKGNFPFLPWFIFVLAGYLFSLRPKPIIPIALALISISTLLHRSGIHNLAIQKYPLSATYSMLFAGVTILIYALGNRMPTLSRSRLVVFISENLMLATILHYISYDILLMVNYPIKHMLGRNVLSSYPDLSMIFAPVVCIVIIVALLQTAIRVWAAMKKSTFINAKVIPNSLAAACTIILLYYLVSSIPSRFTVIVTRFIMISGMAYFGIVTREARKMEYMDIDIIYTKLGRIIDRCFQATFNR